MPRRKEPHPLGEAIGARIRELRQEAGLTLEKLAWESELGSKGYLSDVEHGLVLPSVERLEVIADRLGCELFDLFVFPQDGDRHLLANLTRAISKAKLKRLLASARDL